MAHYTDEEIRQIIIARKRAERIKAENRDVVLMFLSFGGLTVLTYIFTAFCACAGLN